MFDSKYILKISNVETDAVKNDLEKLSSDEIQKKYINVVKYSDEKLGSKLSLGHPRRFNCVFGTCGSIRNGIDYIRTENYPKDLLHVSKLTKKQIDRIPTKKRNIVNFVSAVAVITYDSITSDPTLIKDIKDSDGIFISYNKYLRKSLGRDVNVYEYNDSLTYYTKIIRVYTYMIKNNMFTIENVKRVIEEMMVDKNVSVFNGTNISINDK